MRFAMGRCAVAVAAATSLAVIRCGTDEPVRLTADASAVPDAAQDVDHPTDAAAEAADAETRALDATADNDASDSATTADAADAAPTSVFELLNRAQLPGSGAVLSMSVRGELAILGRALSDGPELVVVRLEPPGSATIVATQEIGASVNAVVLEDRRAYLATSDDVRELVIVDVHDATAPSVMGALDAAGNADGTALDVVGHRVTLGRMNGPGPELLFVDASDSAAPRVLGSADVAGDVTDLETHREYAYVATTNPSGELAVLDYRNVPFPGSPMYTATDAGADAAPSEAGLPDGGGTTTIATFDLPGPARALDLNEARLYVVGGDSTSGYLAELEVPPRAAPYPLTTVTLAGEPTDVVAYGAYLMIAMGAQGVVAYDRPRPPIFEKPRVLDRFFSQFGAQSLAFDDHVMLVGGATSSEVGLVRSDIVPKVVDRSGDGIRTLSVLGDQNSARPDEPMWVDDFFALLVAPDWKIVNRAEPTAWLQYSDTVPNAYEQLATTTANDSPDAVAIAFGTNDLSFMLAISGAFGVVPGEQQVEPIVDELLKVRKKCEVARLTTFIALTPPAPTTEVTSQIVFELNHLIRTTIDPATLLDFHSTMIYPDDFEDELHVGPTGSAKRALEAWRKFEPDYTLPGRADASTP